MRAEHFYAMVVAFTLGLTFGIFRLDTIMGEYRAEAVKRGAAEWVVDPATGETEFRWKEVAP